MAYLEYAWQVRACKPGAEEFATKLIALLKAEKTLSKACKAVPSYTGDRSSRDYVAEEQEAWNRAADDVYDHITQ